MAGPLISGLLLLGVLKFQVEPFQVMVHRREPMLSSRFASSRTR
jgi:hypothetical protein